ncbi:MAG: radical SAM family heme chaperone HemW [Candidatus Kapabacteria bacterium]|nr:radical SAM family heme chaperone HemW [Candidatus Kapabacteria bacterium]
MFGLYLHIPFCEKKCSYCDFYSLESTQHIDAFVETLLTEIDLRGVVRATRVDDDRATRGVAPTATSVFFGGGTPSLLSPDAMQRIVTQLRDRYTIAPDAEWTMECNPGTVTPERLAAYRASGINRLSFGVQSFTASELVFLDRIHGAAEAVAAMSMARAAGFDNVNMDLMFAVPGQTMETLAYNLERMLILAPDHISAYSLIYEHGTPLFARLKKGLVTPTSEDIDAAMYALVIKTLTDAGYEQYEVSNFARPGKRCIHNLTYWHGENYLAFGPSAHGYIGSTRYWNHRSLTAWTAKVHTGELPEANRESLNRHEELIELLFLTLRADGIPRESIYELYGVDLRSVLQPDLSYWVDAGFIIDDDATLRLTGEGYRVCDELTIKVIHAVGDVHSDLTPSETRA